MDKEGVLKMFIEKGYVYNGDTGLVISKFGNVISYRTKYGYVQMATKHNGKEYRVYAHRFGWYYTYGNVPFELDHINGIRDDNKICNLRSVTKSQNQWNRIEAKGYTWDKQSKKWQAQIRFNGKYLYLGKYSSQEEARTAYLKAKEKYHK